MKADRENSLFDPNQIALTRLFDGPRRREAASAAGSGSLAIFAAIRRASSFVIASIYRRMWRRMQPIAPFNCAVVSARSPFAFDKLQPRVAYRSASLNRNRVPSKAAMPFQSVHFPIPLLVLEEPAHFLWGAPRQQ
jgi:hypothetical protein